MLYIGYRTRSRGQEFVVHDSHTCPQLRLTLDLVYIWNILVTFWLTIVRILWRAQLTSKQFQIRTWNRRSYCRLAGLCRQCSRPSRCLTPAGPESGSGWYSGRTTTTIPRSEASQVSKDLNLRTVNMRVVRFYEFQSQGRSPLLSWAQHAIREKFVL